MTFQKVEEWKNADLTPTHRQRGSQWCYQRPMVIGKTTGWKALTAELPQTPSPPLGFSDDQMTRWQWSDDHFVRHKKAGSSHPAHAQMNPYIG